MSGFKNGILILDSSTSVTSSDPGTYGVTIDSNGNLKTLSSNGSQIVFASTANTTGLDSRFVSITGSTMTGNLTITGGTSSLIAVDSVKIGGGYISLYNDISAKACSVGRSGGGGRLNITSDDLNKSWSVGVLAATGSKDFIIRDNTLDINVILVDNNTNEITMKPNIKLMSPDDTHYVFMKSTDTGTLTISGYDTNFWLTGSLSGNAFGKRYIQSGSFSDPGGLDGDICYVI